MQILADENIPFVHHGFSDLGEVVTLAGRDITPEAVARADMLLVRSVTRVDSRLLRGSRVKFVATATSGYEHIDRDYLARQNIAFAYAPGCNANAVAEYVLSALCALSVELKFSLRNKTVGIIGCGHVGSAVLRKLTAVGVRCLVNDPPLQEQGRADLLPLSQVSTADIVTLHVPLERRGRHPTYYLIDKAFLEGLRENTILINTSRGGVVQESALKRVLAADNIFAVVDVWENEPEIDSDLLDLVTFGTPHIAGYSLEGKIKGTEMIYRQACQFLGIKPKWRLMSTLLPTTASTLTFADSVPDDEVIRESVLASYDIREDDAKLRELLARPAAEHGAYFDALRKNYPSRREFPCTKVGISRKRRALAQVLRALGFQVAVR